MWLSHWFFLVTIATQAAASPSTAEPIITRQPLFAIPFRVERSEDPSWQPVEARLYVSTDHGVHWQQYAKAETNKKHFMFRVGDDGEYWFAVRTADRSGQVRPTTIDAPGLRVLVDTKPPVLKLTARPAQANQVSVRWEIDEQHVKPNSLNLQYRTAPTAPWQLVATDAKAFNNAASPRTGTATFWPKLGSSDIQIRAEVSDTAGNSSTTQTRLKLGQVTGPRPSEASLRFQPSARTRQAKKPTPDANLSAANEPKGSVAIAINPAIGSKFSATAEPVGDLAAAPGLPPGERPRMVNSRLFELEYDVDAIGPSGIGHVELWGTRDNGQTWQSITLDSDNRSPLLVKIDGEGIWGFRVTVTNGAGLGGKPPVGGDSPDLWIGIDLTKPTAKIVSVEQGTNDEAGHLIISWQADDRALAARPISLLFSESVAGPWTTIASGLENTGRYAWPIDNRTPPRFYWRLEVQDEAGNVGADETTKPVVIDQSRPTVRIRNIRPVRQP